MPNLTMSEVNFLFYYNGDYFRLDRLLHTDAKVDFLDNFLKKVKLLLVLATFSIFPDYSRGIY